MKDESDQVRTSIEEQSGGQIAAAGERATGSGGARCGFGAGVGLTAHAVTGGALRSAITQWLASKSGFRSALILAARSDLPPFAVPMIRQESWVEG